MSKCTIPTTHGKDGQYEVTVPTEVDRYSAPAWPQAGKYATAVMRDLPERHGWSVAPVL